MSITLGPGWHRVDEYPHLEAGLVAQRYLGAGQWEFWVHDGHSWFEEGQP